MYEVYLEKIKKVFPKAFIYKGDEMILIPELNVYFLLENVHSELELDCKVLEYCSRPATKNHSAWWRGRIMNFLRNYFKKPFHVVEMELLYTYIGNGVNRKLCKEFLKSDCDMQLIVDHSNMKREERLVSCA